MLLNELKNNEIYSTLLAQKKGSLLEWIDLVELKKQLKQNPESYSDEALETLLFGEKGRPRFSGFTEARIEKYLSALGDILFSTTQKENLIVRAEIEDFKIDLARKQALQERINRLKKHEWRKKARAKIKETICRVREPLVSKKLKQKEVHLNLGAGGENYPGFVKIDWAGSQHVFDDIVTLKKVENSSVDEIYSNHVLEHIPIFLIPTTLKRWKEVLKPSGILRLRMPDARQAICNLHETWSEVKAEELKRLGFQNYLSKESVFSGIVDDQLAIQFVYGWSDSMPDHWDMSNQHKSLWTPGLGKKRLEAAGFSVETAQNLGTLQTVLIARRLN